MIYSWSIFDPFLIHDSWYIGTFLIYWANEHDSLCHWVFCNRLLFGPYSSWSWSETVIVVNLCLFLIWRVLERPEWNLWADALGFMHPMQTCADLCRLMQTRADSCRLVQIFANSCTLMKIRADWCRLVQSCALLCSLVQTCADSCRLV